MNVTCLECGSTETLASNDLDHLPQEQWSLITDTLCDDCFMLMAL